MKRAYIGVGSNLSSPIAQVKKAVEQLTLSDSIKVKAISNWYGSTAIGPGNQPDYVNGAIAIETSLTAEALLDTLQRIEALHGRERSIKWSARTLDLDLLCYNDERIQTERLIVPHPRICERNFVLLPLSDLAPELILDGKSLRVHLESIGTEGIWKL